MNKDFGLPEEVLINLARTEKLSDEDKEQLLILLSKGLDEVASKEFIDVVSGRKLPSLSSDIIAKRIFDAELHPERLEYLLRKATSEDNIVVVGPAKMEGYVGFVDSKRMVHDIPAYIEDGRISDTEFQVKAQDFILPRMELYGSDLLLIQYSKKKDKGTLNYDNASGVLLIVLMVESPKDFRDFDDKSDRYIHRFEECVADSGFCYSPLCKTVYIQLDKAYAQLKESVTGEKDEKFQTLLAAMKDINDPDIQAKMKEDEMFSSILEEVISLAQDKEVQIMLLAEKYAMADIATMKARERNDGQSDLINAVLDLRSGMSQEEAVKKYGEETVRRALIIK